MRDFFVPFEIICDATFTSHEKKGSAFTCADRLGEVGASKRLNLKKTTAVFFENEQNNEDKTYLHMSTGFCWGPSENHFPNMIRVAFPYNSRLLHPQKKHIQSNINEVTNNRSQ